MLILTLPALAAEAPDTEVLRTFLSQAAGKDVPEKFMCVEKPALPEPFAQDDQVFVLGTKVKGRGCVRQAIVFRGRVEAEMSALPAVLGDAWKGLDGDTREDVVNTWTRDVLHVWDALESGPKVTSSGKNTTAEVTLLRRTKVPMVAEELGAKWTFDPAGMARVEETDPVYWQSRMVLKANNAKGITEEQVMAGLESAGKIFEKCFWAAWNQDPQVKERTRLTWNVMDGKAEQVASRQQSSGQLAQCYANALALAKFEADGFVDMDFGVVRATIDALPTE